MTDGPIPPPDDQRRAAVYRLETVDITRLYALLRDADQIKAIGENIIKALITDVLRSKLAFGSPDSRWPWRDVYLPPPWGDTWPDSWTDTWTDAYPRVPPATANVIQEILIDVSLSEDELRIVRELNLRLHE